MTWRERAVCQDMADETYAVDDPFFPRGNGNQPMVTMEAMNACDGCPVKNECLADALRFERGLAASARFGYFGGTTGAQRAKLDPTAPRINRGGRLTAQARQIRIEMYQAGATDLDIADELGVSVQSITAWRSSLGAEQASTQRFGLWQQGHTDRQIAEQLGEELWTIKKWRGRKKLAANGAAS